jgi:hypothetical protein
MKEISAELILSASRVKFLDKMYLSDLVTGFLYPASGSPPDRSGLQSMGPGTRLDTVMKEFFKHHVQEL